MFPGLETMPRALFLTTLDQVEGHIYVRRPHARKPCAPFGGGGGSPMHLYGMCMRRCPKLYRPMATWSDRSVFFPEHAHIHGCMETSKHHRRHNNLLRICLWTQTHTKGDTALGSLLCHHFPFHKEAFHSLAPFPVPQGAFLFFGTPSYFTRSLSLLWHPFLLHKAPFYSLAPLPIPQIMLFL